VISPTQPPFTQELIEQKMYLKTARYSFVQPMRLGFAAAGSLDTRNEFAETYGRALGLMFQLQDDLIDVTEGHDKSSFLDIETKQQTLLSWYMQTKAADVSKTQFAHYFGKTLTDDDRRTVATLLQESGARAYVETQIEKYYQEASMYAGTDVWKAVAAMVYQRSN
jgi:geranylgeranyl diphosphate synthase type II